MESLPLSIGYAKERMGYCNFNQIKVKDRCKNRSMNMAKLTAFKRRFY